MQVAIFNKLQEVSAPPPFLCQTGSCQGHFHILAPIKWPFPLVLNAGEAQFL
jgi:hypothetical protein